MAENFPNLGEKTDIRIQEAQRTIKKNSKKSITGHAVINLSNVKIIENFERRKKKMSCHMQGNPIRLLVDFLSKSTCQKGVGLYVQSAQNKKLPNMKPVSGKTVLSK